MTDPEWWRAFFEHPDSVALSFFPSPHTTRHEVRGVVRLCRLNETHRILDICCGMGRHLMPLRAGGYWVAGLDHAAYMLRLARERAGSQSPPLPLVRGEAQRLPFRDAAFDRALCLFNSFGYMARDEDNAAVLHEAFRCLRPGGLFLLETRNKAHQIEHVPFGTLAPLSNGRLARLRCVYDASRSRLVSTWLTPEGDQLLHYASVRLYGWEELQALCSAAGLRVLEVHSTYDGQPFTGSERQLILLAQRP